MKIDFHTHGKLAKKLPFSNEYTDWLFRAASKAGLNTICLTEHFNTLGFDEIYKYIMNTYEKDGDTFVSNGVHIFPGMETDIAEGGHILSIGPMDVILELNHRLDPYKEKSEFITLEKLFELFDEYPVIVGAGHPYRRGGYIPEQSIDLLKKFDFLDLNGKDMAENTETNREKIDALSKLLQIPYVAGSDTHQAFQYGCIWNNFEKDCNTVNSLIQEIRNGNYEIEVKKDISFRVEAAATLKKALKQVHSLGGDYVSILVDGVEE